VGKTVLKGKTVLGHSNPRITQRLERQFTSELMSVKEQEESFCTHQSDRELSLWSLSYRSSKINTGRQDLGLGSGFDRDPLDLDRPGRQLHQRDYARQGWAAKTSQPSWGPRDPGQNLHADTAYKRPTNNRQGGLSFGLWRVRFPPCLVRPGRRLPVQGLREGSLGCLDRLPAWRGPGTLSQVNDPESSE